MWGHILILVVPVIVGVNFIHFILCSSLPSAFISDEQKKKKTGPTSFWSSLKMFIVVIGRKRQTQATGCQMATTLFGKHDVTTT